MTTHVVLAARLATPAIVLVFSLAFLVAITDLPGEAANYPRLVIAALVVSVLVNAVREMQMWRRERRDAAAQPPGTKEIWTRWHRAAFAILLLGVYIAVIPHTGFYPATAGFLLLLLPAAGMRNPLHILAGVAVLLGGSYLLFTQLLQVLLPRGPLS
jgi:hypothetical protein